MKLRVIDLQELIRTTQNKGFKILSINEALLTKISRAFFIVTLILRKTINYKYLYILALLEATRLGYFLDPLRIV